MPTCSERTRALVDGAVEDARGLLAGRPKVAPIGAQLRKRQRRDAVKGIDFSGAGEGDLGALGIALERQSRRTAGRKRRARTAGPGFVHQRLVAPGKGASADQWGGRHRRTKP